MEKAVGRSAVRRCTSAIRRRSATFPLCLLAVLGICSVLASAAIASPPSFTWAGVSTLSENWSFSSNWEGGVAPTSEIGTLTFPRLTTTACTIESGSHPCYFSFNDVSGLSAEAMQLDDGNSYLIGGDEVALGGGGLTAAPASGASGPAGDFIEMPLRLTASQAWSIADRSGDQIGENGMALEGALTGSGSALTAELSNGPAWILANSTEVGPMTIAGMESTGLHIANGLVILEGGELNSADEHPVNLSRIFFTGSGAVGQLTTNNATLDVGSGAQPVGAIAASSVKLDAASTIGFEVSGAAAQQGYAQLTSHGAVELSNASIEVLVRPPAEGQSCPALLPGQTFTFVSTTGTLSGSFADAPEGGLELPIGFTKSCSHSPQTMRISYSRNGGTETVTGTVEADAVKKHQEEEVNKKHEEEAASTKRHEEEEASRKLNEERANKAHEEALAAEVAATTRRHQEEAAAVAAATKKQQEEEAAKGGVLASKEGSPDATLAGTSLQANAIGAVSIKINCPAGQSSCAGTVTLRTLGAVSAGVAGAAKAKHAILTLATGSFAVLGGEVKTVTLHLSAKARALLARSRTLRVRATVLDHNPAGAIHTGQTIATLHAPKAKHGKH